MPDFSSPNPGLPFPSVAIVGLGLIGGSVAMALRGRGLARRIVAVGRNRGKLEEAERAGIVDAVHTDLESGLAGADLILLATPVEIIVSELPAIMAAAPARAIVTDGGSTKSMIVAAGDGASQPGGAAFVGSHPMAGSDKTGWQNGRPDLFVSAGAFVAVSDKTNLEAAARVAHFWRSLGSRVIVCGPERHDALVAAVSHLPHLAAVALVKELSCSGEDPNLLRLISGPGLRDTTRVAKGDPELWQQICLQNSTAIADGLERTADHLRRMAEQVRRQECDALREVLQCAQKLRRQLDCGNNEASGE